jgi:hypothetical protein
LSRFCREKTSAAAEEPNSFAAERSGRLNLPRFTSDRPEQNFWGVTAKSET